jgi:hypothetical protein
MKTCKILVRVQPSSLELLRYVDKNLSAINSRGYRISIEKLTDADFDDDFVTRLSRKGIVRLPAMIDSCGVAYVGLKQIVDVFESANADANKDRKISPELPNAEFGSDPLLSKYWQREMFQRDDSGKMEPRKDDDEPQELEFDRELQRKLSQYERKTPKQRRNADPIDFDPAPRRRPPRDNYDDNIDSGDDDDRGVFADRRYNDDMAEIPLAPSDGLAGEDVDRRMMSAWLQNNGPSSD